VCSSCSIRANAAVFPSVRISNPPGDLLRPTSQIVAVLLSEIISLAGIDFEIRSYDRPISESSRSRFLLGVDHANRRSLYRSRQDRRLITVAKVAITEHSHKTLKRTHGPGLGINPCGLPPLHHLHSKRTKTQRLQWSKYSQTTEPAKYNVNANRENVDCLFPQKPLSTTQSQAMLQAAKME